MAGPRTDKQDAWECLEAQVRFSVAIKRALFVGTYISFDPETEADVLFDLKNLQESGRFDVQQIKAIQVLVRHLHRLLLDPGKGMIVGPGPGISWQGLGMDAPPAGPAHTEQDCEQ